MKLPEKMLPGLSSIELTDNLEGFPKATITQLEEALEERERTRRSEAANTYPMNRERRKNDRRRSRQDLKLCTGD